MIGSPRNVLVVHTAFIGDIILTLPMVQALRTQLPDASITFVAIPSAAGVLANHPGIREIIVYDKKGMERGVGGMVSLARRLRKTRFEVALVPHRSLRSAALVWLARIPKRVGFHSSAGRWLFTDVVRYRKESHEIDRNLSLLQSLGLSHLKPELPSVYPSFEDDNTASQLLNTVPTGTNGWVAFAPGSVWNTKRWPWEHFVSLGQMLVSHGHSIVLIGGSEDATLCHQIATGIGDDRVVNAAGQLTLLQSAALIARCRVAISNDSAPMHLAVAVRTPVVAIFGATVPEFGFAPRGPYDVVSETKGLACRPCSIHGGDRCPIKTFVCMNDLSPESVFQQVQRTLQRARAGV